MSKPSGKGVAHRFQGAAQLREQKFGSGREADEAHREAVGDQVQVVGLLVREQAEHVRSGHRASDDVPGDERQ